MNGPGRVTRATNFHYTLSARCDWSSANGLAVLIGLN